MSRLKKSIGIAVILVMILGVVPMSAFADGLATPHKYLGFGTVLLAGATAATSSDVDIHEGLAYATAACALSAVLTGYLEHRERFDMSDGLFTQDNMHIMAGTIGALMLTTGVILAANSLEEESDGSHDVDMAHAGLAATGGALMAIAIIDIEW